VRIPCILYNLSLLHSFCSVCPRPNDFSHSPSRSVFIFIKPPPPPVLLSPFNRAVFYPSGPLSRGAFVLLLLSLGVVVDSLGKSRFENRSFLFLLHGFFPLVFLLHFHSDRTFPTTSGPPFGDIRLLDLSTIFSPISMPSYYPFFSYHFFYPVFLSLYPSPPYTPRRSSRRSLILSFSTVHPTTFFQSTLWS